MRRSNPKLFMTALAVLGLLAIGVAACGSNKSDRSLLTSTRANDLSSTLDDVQQMVDDGDCQNAQNTVFALQQKVNALPARTDAGLRDALNAGASRLQQLVQDQCQAAVTGPTGPTVQTPTKNEQGGPGKHGKGKAKGHDKNKHEEVPQDGTTGPTVPDANSGVTTP